MVSATICPTSGDATEAASTEGITEHGNCLPVIVSFRDKSCGIEAYS